MPGVIFVNPSSGVKLPERELQDLLASAEEAGLEAIQLGGGVDPVAVIRDALRRDRRLFVAAGGDGTVNHVLQPLVNSEAVLAVIPLGTYNHFARDLGVPLDWRQALKTAVSGSTRQIDVARVNDRFFVNNLSIGLYPHLVARRERKGRDYSRWKARLIALGETIHSYPHVTVAIESDHHQELVRTHVLMVSNNSYDLSRIGVSAPRNTLEEGRLSVYWLPHLPRLALTKFVAHYLAGRVREAPGFRNIRTRQMKVQASRPVLEAGIDGELFTLATPLVITSVPQSLLVRVPPDTMK